MAGNGEEKDASSWGIRHTQTLAAIKRADETAARAAQILTELGRANKARNVGATGWHALRIELALERIRDDLAEIVNGITG